MELCNKSYLVYLAGPIRNLTPNGANEWRKYVLANVPSFIHTFSPLRGKQRIDNETIIKDTYEDNPLTSAKGINMRDFFDVQRSDAIFVNVLRAKEVSIGTVTEIAWARAFNKPVILIMEKKGNPHQHSMFLHSCGFVTDDLDHGIELLVSLLGSDRQIEYYKTKEKN